MLAANSGQAVRPGPATVAHWQLEMKHNMPWRNTQAASSIVLRRSTSGCTLCVQGSDTAQLGLFQLLSITTCHNWH